MDGLRISLFGNLQITHESCAAEVKIGRAAQALLAFLLLNRHRSHRREILVDLFWSTKTQKRARKCLSTTLWRLRQALEPEAIAPGTYLIAKSTGEVGFNLESNYWLDVAVFEEKVNHLLTHVPSDTADTACIFTMEEAIQLYAGDLLEGFYNDWALRERERLRITYLKGLAYLMRAYWHCGNYDKGLVYGQKILDIDPLREGIHRDMMRLYLDNGQQDMARQQYEKCKEILAQEMNIGPMTETQALFAQMVPVASSSPTSSPTSIGPGALAQALQQLNETMRGLESAREQLQNAMQMVKSLVE